jgi:poly-gamma-glutamate capsule biosynthesis protein CapA/YwtB (metallophosphatase superfamily)
MLMRVRAVWWFIFLLLACDNKPAHELSVIFGGDVMLDRGIRVQINRNGMAYFTDGLVPEISKADYAIVNLECPVTDVVAPLTKKYVFRAEPEWLKDLRDAGITHCILANNHSYDQGRAGLISTARNAAHAGITPIGFGSTQSAACAPVVLLRNGMEVVVFSSVTLPLEGWMYLDDSPGMCQASIDDLVRAVSSYRAGHPGSFIVVTLHWGVEYQSMPTAMQREQAKALVNAGTDLIIGHHPHVVQTYERIDGKPVFYSIGNLIFDNPRAVTHRGILVKLTLRGKENGITIIPYEAVKNKPMILPSEITTF